MEKSTEEKRYIDANALIRKHCKTSVASVWGQFGEEHWYSDSVDVDDIKRFPTADVEEVKHGEWIISRTDRGWNGVEFPTHCKCSFCNKEIPYQDRDVRCSRCGAKMDLTEVK